MFTRILGRTQATLIGNVSSTRTGWFTTPINTKIEVSNLTNNNFIKIGETYYNPQYIKSIKINNGLVEMDQIDSRHSMTLMYDENAVHHFTNLFHNNPIKK